MTSRTPTISWHRVQDNGDTFSEKANSQEYHQLLLNHSVTGIVEIIVNFSSSACEKSSSVEYTGKSFHTV